jgi:predicted SprT family Zn-dependent metalloprotease
MEIDNVLKTAWIKQLKADWKTANYHYFKDSMRLPSLELSSAEGVLGKWKGSYHRHLSISINLISNYTWEYVQEVLYHEMAHQYVEEVLGIREELPHGEAFKRICLENGIDSYGHR